MLISSQIFLDGVNDIITYPYAFQRGLDYVDIQLSGILDV